MDYMHPKDALKFYKKHGSLAPKPIYRHGILEGSAQPRKQTDTLEDHAAIPPAIPIGPLAQIQTTPVIRGSYNRLDQNSVIPAVRDTRKLVSSFRKCRRGGVVRFVCPDGVDNIIPVRCKSWSCPDCALSKKMEVQQIIWLGLSVLQHSAFITTTWQTDDQATKDAEYVRRIQLRLVEWLRKRTSPDLQYFVVREYTKKGQLHLHWIVGPWEGRPISKQELSDKWKELTKTSFIVDIQRVRSIVGMSKYLSKYLTKSMEGPRKLRRWAVSRRWPRDPIKFKTVHAAVVRPMDRPFKPRWERMYLEDIADGSVCPRCTALVATIEPGRRNPWDEWPITPGVRNWAREMVRRYFGRELRTYDHLTGRPGAGRALAKTVETAAMLGLGGEIGI